MTKLHYLNYFLTNSITESTPLHGQVEVIAVHHKSETVDRHFLSFFLLYTQFLSGQMRGLSEGEMDVEKEEEPIGLNKEQFNF